MTVQSVLIDTGRRVHIGAHFDEHACGLEVAELRRHVEE
jgi:hypothetical protein